jgi:LuxR family maltose regulon positive regulatory protein
MIFGLCHRLLGDYQQAIEDFTSAMHQNLEAGYVYMAFITINIVAKLNMENGKLETAMRVCQKALDLEAQLGYKTPLSGFTYLLLSDFLYQSGDVARAEACLNRGKDLVILHGDVYSSVRVYFTMARIKLAMGKRSQAIEMMKEMNTALQDIGTTRSVRKIAEAYEAFICVYADRLAQAKRWLTKSRYDDIVGDGFLDLTSNQYMGIYRPTQDLASHMRNFAHMTAARVLLADGAAEEAFETIGRVLAQLEIDSRIDQKIEALTLQALALQDLRKMDEALRACEDAISLAAPEGYLQFFLLLGRGMQGLLVTLKRHKLQRSTVLTSEDRAALTFIDVILNRFALASRS